MYLATIKEKTFVGLCVNTSSYFLFSERRMRSSLLEDFPQKAVAVIKIVVPHAWTQDFWSNWGTPGRQEEIHFAWEKNNSISATMHSSNSSPFLKLSQNWRSSKERGKDLIIFILVCEIRHTLLFTVPSCLCSKSRTTRQKSARRQADIFGNYSSSVGCSENESEGRCFGAMMNI